MRLYSDIRGPNKSSRVPDSSVDPSHVLTSLRGKIRCSPRAALSARGVEQARRKINWGDGARPAARSESVVPQAPQEGQKPGPNRERVMPTPSQWLLRGDAPCMLPRSAASIFGKQEYLLGASIHPPRRFGP